MVIALGAQSTLILRTADCEWGTERPHKKNAGA